jgi:trans-2,3-dihydro-3-hydroxyanthranilate isomerase
MAMRRYTVVDVFTDTPLEGNPAAVFTDATGLSAEVMQRAARELNLSETVFVLRSEHAHLRVRIFTPAVELPFAGHPILGTAFVVGRAMGSPVVRLETGLGVVPVTLTRGAGGADPVYGEMEQPIPAFEEFDAADALLAALGLDGDRDGLLPIQAYRNGPVHVYVELPDFDAVAALRPDRWPCTWLGMDVSGTGARSRSCRGSRSAGARCCARGSTARRTRSSALSWAGRR